MAGALDQGLATARHAAALEVDRALPARALVEAALAQALILRGHAPEARRLVGTLIDSLEAADLFAKAPEVTTFIAHPLTGAGKYALAESILDRVMHEAERTGAVSPLPLALALALALAMRSELEFRRGEWISALADADRSVRLAEDTGQRNELAFSLVCRARVYAGRGVEDACNADLERASELAGALGIGSISTHLSAIRGFLELGLGHAQAAIEQLEPIRRMVEDHRLGEPGMVPWRPDLIEACARAGDRTRALTELDVLELEAQQSENIWARGAVARLRGLLQDRGHVDDNFALALECHPPMVSPFEWARTRLCHGERMRRDRRTRQAAAAISDALNEFERLGAHPWAERARAELRASGAHPARDQTAPILDQLTAQELQVALEVATGATNQDAASRLFLSPKTIDYHLGKIYRKLGIRSRTQLAALAALHDARTTHPAAE